MSSATTRSRPIINTRDEPHADSEIFRRLHVIVGDSNMNECTTFVKVGSALCMLRMIEDETFDLRDFTLENPARAIREISHDITCTKKVKLASGREMSALEIQREFVQRAHAYAETRGFSAEEQQALEMWSRYVDGLGSDLMRLRTEIDWITKLHLVEQFRARHGVALDDPKVQMLDLQYHDIRRDRGVFFALRNQQLVRQMCSENDIASAMVTPPQTTRARLRGEFIKAAKLAQRDYTVDWVHLKLNDHHQRTVVCNDPLKSHDERVDRLISSL
jgi:proteasome accessory factor A